MTMEVSRRRSSAVVWGLGTAVILLMSCCGGAWAATYEVGGTGAAGWTIPTATNGLDYTTWADSNTYRVNDVLHFTYSNGAHNVQPLPTSASYDSCDLTVADGSLLETGGDTSITLTTAGPAYFVCEIPGHCGLGMKFQINVLAATGAPSSSPSGTPVSSPTIGAPVSSPTAGTPVSSPTIVAPVSSPTTGTPVPSPTIEAPVSSPTVGTPVPSPTIEAPVSSPTAGTPVASPAVETPISSPRPLGPRGSAPEPQDSSAPLSTFVSGSLAVVVLASTMQLLSSLV